MRESKTLACPNCAGSAISRSRRVNLFERIAKPIINPWRCDGCGYRFYAFSWSKPKPADKVSEGASA
jgi:ribosomal protein L37AE/L43A